MRSRHTDSTLSYFCASNCFVPGSSVFKTRTGCLYSGNEPSKSVANAPILLSTRASVVSRTRSISVFVSFSLSLFTPALAYAFSLIPVHNDIVLDMNDVDHLIMRDNREEQRIR